MFWKLKNKFFKAISTSIALILPQFAFAASTEVGRIVGAACAWLSGEVAAGIAVLVVIYSGYEMLHGDIDKTKFAARIVGIGLIVGAAYIVSDVLGVR